MISIQIHSRFLKVLLLFGTIYLFAVQGVFAQFTGTPTVHEVSSDSTFDVITWNIEWFGSDNFGPEDADLQMNNVIKVIETTDADLYALQEIANQNRFSALADSLEHYRGFAAKYSQTQKAAYLFKTSMIDSLDSGLLHAQQNDFHWADRLPLFFEFNVAIAGRELRVFTYNIHAKAFSDQESYNRREHAANSLKRYLDRARPDASVIVLGDFNDGLVNSTYEDGPSPYRTFTEDDFYLTVTKPLEEQGMASYLPEEYRSFIDHMITTNVLKTIHIPGSQQVVDTGFIDDFISTTSDHAPVWASFDFTRNFDDPFEEIPENFVVTPNYPNPFNPSTTISFSLQEPSGVTATVYDILGRKVKLISDNRNFEAGEHTIEFNADGLTSGIYLCRIELDSGESNIQKMTLIR